MTRPHPDATQRSGCGGRGGAAERTRPVPNPGPLPQTNGVFAAGESRRKRSAVFDGAGEGCAACADDAQAGVWRALKGFPFSFCCRWPVCFFASLLLCPPPWCSSRPAPHSNADHRAWVAAVLGGPSLIAPHPLPVCCTFPCNWRQNFLAPKIGALPRGPLPSGGRCRGAAAAGAQRGQPLWNPRQGGHPPESPR